MKWISLAERFRHPTPRRWFSPIGAGLGLLALLTGCQSLKMGDSVTGPSYEPTNIAVASSQLPADCRRVVVLPLAIARTDQNLEHGRKELGPVLVAELTRAKRFEVQAISPEQLQRWSGRLQWLASDALPPHFFSRLREETGCDAVLFAELREYRPYPPQAQGWRLQLVQVTGERPLWAVEEVFDAGDERVVNAARRYQLDQQRQTGLLQESRSILASPRRFGQYTTAALAATLPVR